MEVNRNFDSDLKSQSQVTVAKIVAGLPDEPLSMVWRSDLNQALRATAAKSKKRRFVINFLSPVAGLSAACLLAVIVLVKPPQPVHSTVVPTAQVVSSPASSSSLEAGLFRLHQDDVRTSDVAGTGLNPTDASANSETNTSDSLEDSEDDIQL